jgi:hypothetical protein
MAGGMELVAPLPPELLIFCVVFGVLAARILGQPAGRRRLRTNIRRFAPRQTLTPSPSTSSDPVSQLGIVMQAAFTAKPVISRTEAQVLEAAEKAVLELGLPWRVLAQVALGEVLAWDDDDAFRAINAKRVDLLVISDRRQPLAAIGYQGEGHWQGNAPARDAVKKEALRRAGIGYIEITPRHHPADVRREIERLAAHLGATRSAPPVLTSTPKT